jgi:cytochrome c biogenesis protein CcmG, thiol:disulfide interchange protein DsbE
MKRFLPLTIFGVLCIFLLIGLRLNPKEVPSPFIGKPAPSFTLPVLNQANTSFSPDQLRGKIWLLNVWASWCVSCREEHPLLVDLATQNIVPIVGLNYKDQDTPATEWLSKMGNPYQLSAVDAKGKVGIDYGVYGVPETFVIGPDGLIIHKFIGPLTQTSIQNELIPLLSQYNGSSGK